MAQSALTIEVFEYTQKKVSHFDCLSLEELSKKLKTKNTYWINVEGIFNPDQLSELFDVLNLHPLLFENIRDMGQSPRLEEYDDQLFVAVKMLNYSSPTEDVLVEHLNLILGKNYLITFQEGLEGDVFSPIRDRLNRSTSRIRARKADYLTYAILDTIIDNYIYIIEMFGEKIERLEQQFPHAEGDELLEQIYEYKMQINFLRKTIRPVREVAVLLEKSDFQFIDDQNAAYFHSLVTHMAQCTEAIETYQIMLNDQLFLYQTRASNRLNDILRTLTIFSVIFIPLTFIAGVYGTNFEYLPEFKYKYAYPMFWGVLLTVAGGMLYYFKRKRWL